MENIDPKLWEQLLTLKDGEVIFPLRMKAEDAPRVKAVKLSDNEMIRVYAFQEYLHHLGFLKDNTFASLFRYLFDLAYTFHDNAYTEKQKQKKEVPL